MPNDSTVVAEPADSLANARVAAWQQHYRRGDLAACEALARAAVDEQPRSAKALQLLGATLLASGRLDEALPILGSANALAPHDWSILDNLGIALQRHGEFEAAAQTFRSALALAPREPALWSNASVNALESGNADEALRLADAAIELVPRFAPAHLNRGNALCALGRSVDAEAACERALTLQPRYAQALLSLGRAQAQHGQFLRAVQTTRRALALDPNYAEAHVNLANYLNALGDIAAAVSHYERALALRPQLTAANSGALFCMLHDDRLTPEQLFAAHAAFGARVEAARAGSASVHDNEPEPERRLRLGFVSGDLRDHPVARFLEPVWRELDRGRFEIFAYDTQPSTDDTAARLRGLADHWDYVAGVPEAALDVRIRGDAIDILFDLSGHTARNCIGVFARKPAPVQVAWIGYPHSTGLATIDYRLIDRIGAPPGRLDHLFSERLAYLPLMSVFDRPRELPAVAPPPCLRSGALTFGSFNRVNKLSSRSVELWARVLAHVPGSRLLIGAVPDATVGDAVRRRLQQAGVDAARIELRPRAPLPDYLRLHAEVDILLDALPFSSGTTANFGLWMGVPTLTLAGDSLPQRLCAARMHAAGLDAFVAESEAELPERAAAWSREPERLARLRAGLRATMEERADAQPKELTRALEQRLREMWRRWCAGLPAETLSS